MLKMEKIIQYFGQQVKVGCDEKCNKAWGGGRPKFYEELGKDQIFGIGQESFWPDKELKDEEDWAYLPDHQLGEAPVDPETYEGGCAKPTTDNEKMNKWCVRACERCVMSSPGEYDRALVLRDFSKPFYNYSEKNK